jgi:hypothetical protein
MLVAAGSASFLYLFWCIHLLPQGWRVYAGVFTEAGLQLGATKQPDTGCLLPFKPSLWISQGEMPQGAACSTAAHDVG